MSNPATSRVGRTEIGRGNLSHPSRSVIPTEVETCPERSRRDLAFRVRLWRGLLSAKRSRTITIGSEEPNSPEHIPAWDRWTGGPFKPAFGLSVALYRWTNSSRRSFAFSRLPFRLDLHPYLLQPCHPDRRRSERDGGVEGDLEFAWDAPIGGWPTQHGMAHSIAFSAIEWGSDAACDPLVLHPRAGPSSQKPRASS